MSHLVRRLTISTIVACVCLLPWTRQPQAQQALLDIGTVGGDTANPEAINAYGQVVGGSNIAGNTGQHAFLWTPATPNGTTGTWTDLGHLGGAHSYAYGINDAGAVVGRTNMPGGSDQAFLWTPETANGTSGTMEPLGTLGGSASEARGVNDTGQIVGWSHWSTSPDHANEPHAFLWSAGQMVDLGTLGGPDSIASAISADGKVVGWSTRADGSTHAFLWTPHSANGSSGEMQDLGSLDGGWSSYARDINALGQVVGYSNLQEQAKIRAFLWTPGATDGDPAHPQIRNLGVSAAESYDASYASGITDDGWVTGHVGQFGSRAFIWVPTAPNATTGGIIDGLTLGGTYAAATGINDAKQIAGWSFLSGNQEYIDPVIGCHPIIHAFVTAPAAAEKFAQTITFGALVNKAFGDPDFAATATASSGLPVSFTADGACELTGSMVHITGNGTCTITASQAGNDNFDPAAPVPQSFDIIGSDGR